MQNNNFAKTDTTSAIVQDTLTKAKTKSVVDTVSQRILLAGDSMADGLLEPLKKYCVHSGHKLIQGGWTSSTIVGWGNSNRLSGLIKKHNPTFVIMVLGANELYTTDFKIREKLVAKIKNESSKAKFVWVGPPNWQEDNGLDDMLRQTLGENDYFSSKKMFLTQPLKSKRGPDKKHPSHDAYKIWADSLAVWIMNKSEYPILLEREK